MKKRLIALCLLVAVLVTSTTSFTKADTINFGVDLGFLSSEINRLYANDLDGAIGYVRGQLGETTYNSVKGKYVASVAILKDFGKVVYIDPDENDYEYTGFGDYQKGDDGNWHHRYLGYIWDESETVTNALFPNVSGSTTLFSTYQSKNWIKKAESPYTWGQVDDKITKFMLTDKGTRVQDNGVFTNTHNLSMEDLVRHKLTGSVPLIEELKQFVAYQATSTLKYWGSGRIIQLYLPTNTEYYRTVDINPVPFGQPVLTLTPREDQYVFEEDEETKNLIVDAVIDIENFPPFEDWNLGNYIEEAEITVEGRTQVALINTNTNQITSTFTIPISRDQYETGIQLSYPLSGSYHMIAHDHFNNDQFAGRAAGSYDVLVNPGEVEPRFEIKWTNKEGEALPVDITNGTIPFYDWQDFNLTLEPSIDIYGENEVTDVLWSFESTDNSEFRFGSQNENYLNTVDYVMNESKKDTHLNEEGTATFTMTTILKHRVEIEGQKTNQIVRTATVDFVQLNEEDEDDVEIPVNTPPNAHIKAPRQVRVGDKFKFSGARSQAGSSPIVSYDFSGSGLKTIKMYDEMSGQGAFLSGSSKTLCLEVVDENNLSDTSSTDIELIDALEADFKVYGDRRVYRIVELDGSPSKDADYYPLEDGGYNWSVTPLEGQDDDSAVFIDGNGNEKVRVLFLEEGAYDIRLSITADCTYEDSSKTETDSVNHPIVIQPDLAPEASFSATQFVLRDRMDSGQATIELVDSSFSPDNDDCLVEWFITKDEDNDGLEGDETYEKIETDDLHAFFKTTEVGNYYAYNVVTEVIPNMDIVGRYIPENAARTDSSRGDELYKRTILVENVAPIVSPTAELKKEVDLLVITDEEGENYTNLISEVNELQKSLYERRIGLNESFVNLKSDTVDKTDVGLLKKQTFNWVRKWYIDAEWELYRRYDYSANGTTKDENIMPYKRVLSGGTVDSRTGTVEDMLSFPTYDQAYAEFQRPPYIDDYRTSGGHDIWQIRRLDVNVYNEPNDFVGAYNYTVDGYGGVKAYGVANVDTDKDFTLHLNSNDFDYRYLTRFSDIEDDPNFPDMFMANVLEPQVDSGWSQGAFISEEDDTLNVALLDAYLEEYRESENEKHLVFAIANGQNLFLPEELRQKLESYGFKVYFSIDEFWGEYTPNVHKVNNIKFEDGALYAQTMYDNQLKNHSNTPVDKLYYRYMKRYDEPVEYEDQSQLIPVEAKTSGTQGLIGIRRVVSIPISDTGEYDDNDRYYWVDPDGNDHELDIEYEWDDGGSPLENLETTDYTNYEIGTEWTLDSGMTLSVDTVWSAGKVSFVVQSGDDYYFVANDVNNDNDYGHQSYSQIDIEGIEEIYTVRTVEPVAKWRTGVHIDRDRYSRSDAYIDWSKHDKTNDLYIIKDTAGLYTLCYMDYSYSQPYTSDIRSIRSNLKQIRFSDLEQFAFDTTSYSLEQGDIGFDVRYRVVDENTGSYRYEYRDVLPWYMYIPPLPDAGENNYYIGDQSKYALRDLRNDGVQGTVTSWMLTDDSGNLYVNGKKEAENAKYPEVEITEDEHRHAYVGLDGRVYGKGHSPTGQYGHFEVNESYEEVFNSPYILGPGYTVTDFASVFDITSKSPAYTAVNRGLYEPIMNAIESCYEDYSETETILIQVGDQIDIGGFILDYEDDPIHETFIDVSHDNTYFDNADTPWSPPNDFSQPVTVDVPGRMLVGLGAIDNPVGNDERFANFRYRNKDNTLIELIVHRPPVAVLGVALVPQGDGTFNFVGTDGGSFDLDHSTSRADKGIVDRKYFYKKELEPSFTEFDGTTPLESGVKYEFALQVKDLEGAWSEFDIQEVEVSSDPFVMSSGTDPSYPTPVQAGGDVTLLADIFTAKAISQVKAVIDYTDSANVETVLEEDTRTGMDAEYSKVIRIPDSVPDGDYDVSFTATAADGAVKEASDKFRVETPISVTGDVSPYEIQKDAVGTITAETPLTAESCYVVLYHGTEHETSPLQLNKGSVSGEVQSWTLTYTFRQDAQQDMYEAEFTAYTASGKASEPYVCPYEFVPNQAPTVSFQEQNPVVCYEGDHVNLSFLITDPDLDTLHVTAEISIDDGVTWEPLVEISDFEVSSLLGEVFTVGVEGVDARDYKVKVTAEDPKGESAQAETNFSAAELWILGQVSHVEQWNLNRIAFNQSKTGTDDLPRPYDMFWPGELFVLGSETTRIDPQSQVICQGVDVEIIDKDYETELSGGIPPNGTSQTLWHAELWNKEMMKWKTESILFRFTATYSNGTIKKDDVVIQIDNSEDYWRYHRLY